MQGGITPILGPKETMPSGNEIMGRNARNLWTTNLS